MKRMIALTRVSYAGRAFQAGEEFEVEDQHEGVFVRVGFARPADEAPEVSVTVKRGRKRQTYKTRVLRAQ